MRGLFAVLLLSAVSAGAQTGTPDAKEQARETAERVRAHRPDTTAGPTFGAEWSEGVALGMGGHHVPAGTFWSAGEPLALMLTRAWRARSFGQAPPISPSVAVRLVDVPDSLRRRPADVAMFEPGLTDDTFGPFLLGRLAGALGLEVRFEERPQVVYALRATAGAPTTLAAAQADERMAAADLSFTAYAQTLAFREQTAAEVARGLGGALGHVVVDETGLDGSYSFALDVDPGVVDFDRQTLSAPAIDAVRAALADATGLELVPEVRPVEWMVVRAAP